MIKEVIEEAKKRGHEVRIRDIAFALMSVKFEDSVIAYTVAFGQPEKEEDVECYEDMDSIKFLKRYFRKDLAPKEIVQESAEEMIARIKEKAQAESTGDGSMTFEENRAGIEQQIREIRQEINGLKENNSPGRPYDVKTMALLQKTEADLRAKLNDKFGASEKSAEQYVIVQPKFNTICNYTHKECYLMTEEHAMKHFHLIKDPNYKK